MDYNENYYERTEMFNRKLQVDVVKTKKVQAKDPEVLEMTFEDKTEIIVKVAERCIKKIGYAVAAYVVLDTLRKIAVEAAKE